VSFVTFETETADEILRTIRQVIRRVSEQSRFLSRNVGLTIPQFVCLKAIGQWEELGGELITVAQIAKEVQLSPATVSRILDRLVKAGFVTRIRSEQDRRKVSLSLTSSGLERYQALPTPLQERFIVRLNALPLEERTQLLDSLRTIADLMDATDIDAAPLLLPGTEAEPITDEA
jgi:DNA-binding MarR family transcriptional regulator